MSFLKKPFRYTYSKVTLYLIAVNVVIFLLQYFTAYSKVFNITQILALNPAAIILRKAYWQFITYMFAHDPFGFTHIIFNMLALFIFGLPLERHIGSREFLLYYMLTGILAGVLSFITYVLTRSYMTFLLGASGALFAVQLAYAAFFPNNVIYIWGILPLRAPVMVIVFTAIELFSSMFGIASSTAHLTHLFGFAIGYLYFVCRWSLNPWKMMFGR